MLPGRRGPAGTTRLLITLLVALLAAPHAADRGAVDGGAGPAPMASYPSRVRADDSERLSGLDAMRFRRLQLLSDDGTIDIGNWLQAHEQVIALQRASRAGATGPATLPQAETLAAGLDPMSWETIGPGNIGGRIRSLVFDPDDPRRIYVGGVSGGVWVSRNGGDSWAPADDFMANLSVTSLVFDPLDSNVMYAGTGESIRGLGIFRSSDKGASWTSLPATRDGFEFFRVDRLAFLNDGSRLLAATSSGIMATEDGGSSWTRVHDQAVKDIDAHPFVRDELVAGGAFGAALYSADGGQSWETATGLQGPGGRVEIAYARSNPDIVYASVGNANGELWRSSDGGRSYSPINVGNGYLLGQVSWNNALWVDPTDANHVVVGGIVLSRSTDGGANLEQMNVAVHVDHHAIVEHPAYDGVTNRQVYFTNDGGVYVATDIDLAAANVGWRKLNSELGVTQFYGVAVAPDGTVVGGTQDNGTLVYKGDPEAWITTYGGDGGPAAIDPEDSAFVYGATQNLGVHRSVNGGYGSSFIGNASVSAGANFIAPLILDPNDPNRLLAGSRELWLSENPRGATPGWRSIKPQRANLSPISAIAVSPGDSDVIYVGHNDGAVFKTFDGTSSTPSWLEVTTPALPNRFLTRIAVDPQDANVVYVSFGGFTPGNLWKSVDAANTWNPASGTAPSALPPAPVRAIAVHPAESNQVYVGTEVGVFASEDGGASWSLSNDGPANVSIDELVWQGTGTLYAATHGRGIFRASVADVVAGGNRPPILAGIGNRFVTVGRQLDIPLFASDPDGDAVRFAVAGLPPFCGPLVDKADGTGAIACSPAAGDQGGYRLQVSAIDAGLPALDDREEVVVTVFRINEAEFVPVAYYPGSGAPVALERDVVAVGTQGIDGFPVAAMTPETGELLALLDFPQAGQQNSSFGAGVALADGRLLVSAESDDVAATDSGAAYLFDTRTGQLLETFTHPNAAPPVSGIGQNFGRSIALDGDNALIGLFRGPVFLFNASTGALLRELPFASTSRDSLALSDSLVGVGNTTAFGPSGQASAGSVSVYDLPGGNLLQRIDNPTPENFDFFGEAVAIDGGRVLVGAGQVDVDGVDNAGEAYLFDAATGALLHTFANPSPGPNAFFGRHLDIDGDLVAIASPGIRDGAVHLFDAVSGTRIQSVIERPMVGLFATSVDLDGGTMAVGANGNGVYLYRLSRFVDTPPDFWAHSFIERLAASGITVGCGEKRYCPSAPVTRAQMAVFLERGMRGAGFSPPAATGAVFADVAATDFAAAFIEQLFADGITSGCGGGNYCPNDAVSRGQMAVFLLRALFGAGYAPPPPSGLFGDVPPGYWAAAWIEQLAAEGITSGCGNGNFCPENPVTRDQMAVFLVRTFGL